jgi:transposase
MPYQIAAVDVHKKMLAVVLTDIEGGGEFQFERRKFGATPDQLHLMAQWLDQKGVEEIVMESTAQYWKPVWATLERYWKPARESREGAGPKAGKLYLCQAKSNQGPRGRKNDFADGQRMIKRLVAGELTLSYVPDPEQRLWRTVTRRESQLTRARVGFKNQLESLLEQGHIKLTSIVSDLLGVSARRMLQAIAKGESKPAVLAGLADRRLRATPEQLRDALGACQELSAAYRRVLQMTLEELDLLEKHIEALEREALELMKAHQEEIQRVAAVPGFGLRSALKMIAEVGPGAAAFRSAKALASWVGVCPGNEESAGESHSTRSPKGNREMRRLLNQSAQAAVKNKGSIFEVTFKRLLPRMEYKEAIWAIAHRLCRVLWVILHQGVRYEERGAAVSAKAKQTRTARMIRELRKLGYQVEQAKVATVVVPA